MKIAITGHTKGIGKALSEVFGQDHEIIGFSRSNGYDITKQEIVDKIIHEIKDCDVFINNAYAPDNQTQLLIKSVFQWEKQDKVVINISSMWCYYDHPHEFIQQYRKEKIHQNNFVKEKIQAAMFAPKIMNVLPGFVDTDMVKDVVAKSKINTTDLANIIKDLFEMRDKMFVREIVIDTPIFPYG